MALLRFMTKQTRTDAVKLFTHEIILLHVSCFFYSLVFERYCSSATTSQFTASTEDNDKNINSS